MVINCDYSYFKHINYIWISQCPDATKIKIKKYQKQIEIIYKKSL